MNANIPCYIDLGTQAVRHGLALRSGHIGTKKKKKKKYHKNWYKVFPYWARTHIKG